MIDFRFKDNQEPSINANNLNAIVDEINSNEAKIKDVESEVAEIVIEHGGSIVVPNPEEEPTEMLNTVKINNDVFELGASGDTGIEVTQAEYDALEEEGKIEADVNYFITDGERSNLLIDDSRTGLNNAWSAHKVNGELDDLKASLNGLSSLVKIGEIAHGETSSGSISISNYSDYTQIFVLFSFEGAGVRRCITGTLFPPCFTDFNGYYEFGSSLARGSFLVSGSTITSNGVKWNGTDVTTQVKIEFYGYKK